MIYTRQPRKHRPRLLQMNGRCAILKKKETKTEIRKSVNVHVHEQQVYALQTITRLICPMIFPCVHQCVEQEDVTVHVRRANTKQTLTTTKNCFATVRRAEEFLALDFGWQDWQSQWIVVVSFLLTVTWISRRLLESQVNWIRDSRRWLKFRLIFFRLVEDGYRRSQYRNYHECESCPLKSKAKDYGRAVNG